MRPSSLVAVLPAGFVACLVACVVLWPLASCTDGSHNVVGDTDMLVFGNVDHDRDGYTIAAGDCNDNDASIHPGAVEICFDHIDQDCDGVADEPCDDDHDTFSIAAGDCNDNDPLIGPGAIEIIGNGIDDNCNGLTDERPAACDSSAANDGPALAGAVELCAPWVVSSTVNADADPRSHAVQRDFGVYHPHGGKSVVLLSTGVAADGNDPGFILPQPGTEFTNDAPNPLPMTNVNNACYAGLDEPTVHDYVEWKLELKVPQNARSFGFDFQFVTAEYPEFVCSRYNDKFFALLDSNAFKGNVSFDALGNAVTVNVGFFDVCQSTMTHACAHPIDDLQGTGYERFDFMNRPIGGGTGWLHTISPVTPNEHITVRFILFDEGDHKFDSTVVIDNFQWDLTPAGGPVTIR